MNSQSENRVRCLAPVPGEAMVVCGDLSGRVMSISLDPFGIIERQSIHAGNITAIAYQPHGRYVACISMDKTVSISRLSSTGQIQHIRNARIRNIYPQNDKNRVFQRRSNSQAIGLHDTKMRLVTRSSNAGLLEIDFEDDGTVLKRHCTRLHGMVDIITARYLPNSDFVLSGAGDGTVALSLDGKVKKTWKIGNHSIHWIEALNEREFLVASDGRFVGRFCIDDDNIIIGPEFAIDDVEQVRYSASWNSAFASSFDRKIYQVDPKSCHLKGTTFDAPFKCRWFSPIEEIGKLLVLTQDGSLHLVDQHTKKSNEWKTAPRALWTADHFSDGKIALTGEGNALFRLEGVDDPEAENRWKIFESKLPIDECSYTKRLLIDRKRDKIVLARTDGQLLYGSYDVGFERKNLGSAIRDITLDESTGSCFAATESGEVFSVSQTAEGLIIEPKKFTSEKPLWCLSFNSSTRELLVAERYGHIYLLDEKLQLLKSLSHPDRYKRCKWLSQDEAILSAGGKALIYNRVENRVETLFAFAGNTVEDFIFSKSWNYIVSINYTQTIFLHDLKTGEVIDFVQDQYDTSKGICWIKGDSKDPKDLRFLTFGRTGNAHQFRIYNDSIMSLGPIELHNEFPGLPFVTDEKRSKK